MLLCSRTWHWVCKQACEQACARHAPLGQLTAAALQPSGSRSGDTNRNAAVACTHSRPHSPSAVAKHDTKPSNLTSSHPHSPPHVAVAVDASRQRGADGCSADPPTKRGQFVGARLSGGMRPRAGGWKCGCTWQSCVCCAAKRASGRSAAKLLPTRHPQQRPAACGCHPIAAPAPPQPAPTAQSPRSSHVVQRQAEGRTAPGFWDRAPQACALQPPAGAGRRRAVRARERAVAG